MVQQEKGDAKYSTLQTVGLMLLRMAVGWHFLYEGLVKLLDPGWSSAGYLAGSQWILGGLFDWILAHPAALAAVDLLNIWGLLLIGLGLFLGMFTRAAAISGITLLSLYWIANPPLVGLDYELFTEGNYLVVDKNLVEMLALLVMAAFPTGSFFGLDRLLDSMRKKIAENRAVPPGPVAQTVEEQPSGSLLERRELIKSLISLPVLGGFAFAFMKKRGWESWEEKHLLAAGGETEAITSATARTFHFSGLKDLKGTLPRARIGNLELSRLILGGNLIGGWAHARDLIYASKLVKAYHHDRKVFETFSLAEQCGVNTILTNPALCRVISEYWRKTGGKIQFISDCAWNGDVLEGIRVSVDGGAHACYVQGGITDRLVPEGKLDVIGEALELIRGYGIPAGIGAHDLNSVIACVEAGLVPDYWVKTLHHTNYWSAIPEEDHDNIWCKKPEATMEYMNNLEQPWIAYKVLAAGAIKPEVGFPYAFNGGADFICVGMYDFQVVDDVNVAIDVLNGDLQRTRPWRSLTIA
ncbi:MAG: DoxX family membrane protein [Candidatus Glassbacteria bacterium]|nr:DoxX family membrane protein [Candidatus Glassbacteria bacterium]